MPAYKDRHYILEVCKIAGFPPPSFDDAGHATIKVVLGYPAAVPSEPLAALAHVAPLTASQFDKWCQPLGLVAIARFLNQQLGTKYQTADVWKLRKGKRKIPARIRALVHRTPKPHDPAAPGPAAPG